MNTNEYFLFAPVAVYTCIYLNAFGQKNKNKAQQLVLNGFLMLAEKDKALNMPLLNAVLLYTNGAGNNIMGYCLLVF